ncbi:AraC family transcriptional regulator [Burkholderia sp. Ac-20345]|uniref:AraC family transcriptional regulator n=1 Tax=Burkholderia sp. Ac-20345 TaxID=2703891 RepID=UPI00197C772B|nr:AraC family transcriptional regulator [Burkholderia sp. Ac-20345]MBN3782858.1 AraC family transcriptional regulator [Burkholderia sp. Ac-20345]
MDTLIRAGALQGYEALMNELGLDPLPLLIRHGINHGATTNTDMLISLAATIELLEESAAVAGCPDLGLRLAAHQDYEMMGVLAVVIQNAPTILQAAEDASRYIFLHTPAMVIAVERFSPLYRDCVTLRLAIQQPWYAPQRQAIDSAIGYMWRLVKLLTEGSQRLYGVSLPHSPLAHEAIYQRFFGAPVNFAQPYAGLHMHQDALTADLAHINPMLRQLALDYISRREMPREKTLTDQVRQAITGTLGVNKGTKLEIAEILGVHPRTLQRRLGGEGNTFEAIREEIHKDATLRFLHETNIPLNQLADVMGFSGQSSFTRRCKHWFGESPSKIRKESANDKG